MKNIIILLCFMICCCNFAFAQNSPKTVQDTSKAMKRTYQPVVVPDPAVSGPQLQRDTLGYNNKIYREGIKSAEYQNRGAEDRRNPNSDPNAIPNQRIPDQQHLEPAK